MPIIYYRYHQLEFSLSMLITAANVNFQSIFAPASLLHASYSSVTVKKPYRRFDSFAYRILRKI